MVSDALEYQVVLFIVLVIRIFRPHLNISLLDDFRYKAFHQKGIC